MPRGGEASASASSRRGGSGSGGGAGDTSTSRSSGGGGGGGGSSSRSSSSSRAPPTASTRSAHRLLSKNTNNNNNNTTTKSGKASVAPSTAVVAEEDHPDLLELEERLNHEVDEEFFQDPRKFHTLHRVIDVLGMQLDSRDNNQNNTNGGWTGNGNTKKGNTKKGGGDSGPLTHDGDPAERGDLEANPAYKVLKQQQQVVEEAIEHLALIHCADLNGSVVQVGRVARQFNDAVTQVRHLRKQVQEIQETLGAGGGAGPEGALHWQDPASSSTPQQKQRQQQVAASSAQAAMSLRELWLKKLEAEAVLSLLDKLDRIRSAPRQFDVLLRQQRIGAAVITVAQALDTMFSSDVAQVQALHKIMEQLMMRKQKAEEVVWELLLDVIFLRTANGTAEALALRASAAVAAATAAAGAHHKTKSKGSAGLLAMTAAAAAAGGTAAGAAAAAAVAAAASGTMSDANNDDYYSQGSSSQPYGTIVNPFLSSKMRYAVAADLQVEPGGVLAAAAAASTSTATSDDDWQEDDVMVQDNMMIPVPVLEAEFDLESEERRHLEEFEQQQQEYYDALTSAAASSSSNPTGVAGATVQQQQQQQQNSNNKKKKLQYGDSILALRTLVECLVRLRRLDDVERILTEVMAKEIEALVQREQARTFLRVEGSTSHQLSRSGGRYAMLLSKAGATTDLRDFRQHLNAVVSAFGNVQLRLAHLAQIIRHRLTTERSAQQRHSAAYSVPNAALATTIQTGQEVMERELKSFLDACLHESQENKEAVSEFNINALTNVSGQSRQVAAKTKSNRRAVNGLETGLFSLGILDSSQSRADSAASTAEAWLTASTTSRRSTIQSMGTPKFVQEVLFTKTTHNGTPQVRHALFFRKALSKWQQDITTVRKQLAQSTEEDTSALVV